jgi:hypothetical protein
MNKARRLIAGSAIHHQEDELHHVFTAANKAFSEVESIFDELN